MSEQEKIQEGIQIGRKQRNEELVKFIEEVELALHVLESDGSKWNSLRRELIKVKEG